MEEVKMKRKVDTPRIKVISEMVKLFTDSGIDYMLGGGTACALLADGVVFQPEDKNHDVDFHVWGRDYCRLDALLRDRNYEVLSSYDFKIQIQLYGILVEMIFLYEEDSGIFFKTTADATRSCYPKECFADNEIRVVGGVEVTTIGDYYCKTIYG